MSKGISFKELQQFFKYTEQAMKDDKTTIIINNEMCRFLYRYLKEFDSYFNMQDKEIERLTNNWNELEEFVKFQRKVSLGLNNGYGVGLCDELLDKMKEIKENKLEEFIDKCMRYYNE